jgi:hypothetical protein
LPRHDSKSCQRPTPPSTRLPIILTGSFLVRDGHAFEYPRLHR